MAQFEEDSFFERQKNKALPETMAEFKASQIATGQRDPKNLHSDVMINFEDIIAEPEGYHSSKYSWHMSTEIYGWGKMHAYELLSFLFGVPMSMFWGCLYAIVACLNVWIYNPLKRSQTIKASCWKNCWGLCIQTCFDPVFQSAGKVFENIDISTEKIVIE